MFAITRTLCKYTISSNSCIIIKILMYMWQ
uniref:Uncharacterized protein n=1 Tax=Heterorhabditis bacteriophora TaxID=37862 RepID=A0A1I7W7S6_HETBA